MNRALQRSESDCPLTYLLLDCGHNPPGTSCQIGGDDTLEHDTIESSGSADAGHADRTLLDLEMKEVSADKRPGNTGNIGDRRRLSWGKYQRQQRRYRRTPSDFAYCARGVP
jgi:hypothetical protein